MINIFIAEDQQMLLGALGSLLFFRRSSSFFPAPLLLVPAIG